MEYLPKDNHIHRILKRDSIKKSIVDHIKSMPEFKNYKDDTLSLKIAGSGDILGVGNVEILTGKINGSGDLLLKELHSKSTKININGSGDAELWVSNSLIAKINGSGDINYHGNPKTVESEINGSGEINAN